MSCCGGKRAQLTRVARSPLGRILARHAAIAVTDALADTRVVLVNGARQCGKSTHLGDQLQVGVVLYTGQQTLPFGPKFRAIPISALWDVPAPRS